MQGCIKKMENDIYLDEIQFQLNCIIDVLYEYVNGKSVADKDYILTLKDINTNLYIYNLLNIKYRFNLSNFQDCVDLYNNIIKTLDYTYYDMSNVDEGKYL